MDSVGSFFADGILDSDRILIDALQQPTCVVVRYHGR